MEPSQASVIKAPQGTLEASMNGLIYLVGLVVVILAVLSFFGLR
jgi:small-conductance mechanosensitive channel